MAAGSRFGAAVVGRVNPGLPTAALSTPCCHLTTADFASEPHVLFGRALLALGAGFAGVVPLGVEVHEREDRDGVAARYVELVGRVAEADDDAAADDLRAELVNYL